MSKDTKDVFVTLRYSEADVARIEAAAEAQRRTRSDFIRIAVEDKVEEVEREQKRELETAA